MKKLKLNVDALEVTSFEAVQAPAEQGTVDGYVLTPKCVVTRAIDSCWCTERTCP
jgi:hypothetical protein